MANNKATEDMFNELHNLVTTEFLKRIKSGELNRENRKRGTYGNGDGKDVSHKKDGSTVLEKASKNRARNRSRK